MVSKFAGNQNLSSFLDTFHTSIKNLSNINKQNEQIDWTHTKINNLSKSIKIYIDENEARIKELENYLNIFSKHSVFQDIQYPLIERIKKLEDDISK